MEKEKTLAHTQKTLNIKKLLREIEKEDIRVKYDSARLIRENRDTRA